jgi:hypothetical protein
VTPAEINFHQRVQLLDHARRTGNVAEACRTFGVSRTRYSEWKKVAERYGLEALMPKTRRVPQLPNAATTQVVAEPLTLAVVEPTIGSRQYADRLAERGYVIARSTVQRHLVAHGLGRRCERLARTAAIVALTTGLVTEAATEDEPFGFCLAAGGPGELVCIDSFYVGNLKGVGKLYQLTAIDVFTALRVVGLDQRPRGFEEVPTMAALAPSLNLGLDETQDWSPVPFVLLVPDGALSLGLPSQDCEPFKNGGHRVEIEVCHISHRATDGGEVVPPHLEGGVIARIGVLKLGKPGL